MTQSAHQFVYLINYRLSGKQQAFWFTILKVMQLEREEELNN